ncbi:MAG: LacI family DNA-binding transcriptional regulator [Verrucomicrobiota bacterium]
MTITELARRLNLSTCTVSKIMNRSFTGVTYASATIRRVEAAALKLGYVPNAHAQSLRTKRSMTIGVVVPSGIPYFTGALVESLEGSLRSIGFETIISHSTADCAKETHLIRNILGRGVDGLLWIPYSNLSPEELMIPISFPLVLLDRPGFGTKFPTVMTDNRGACRELASRIATAGQKSVMVLSSDCGDKSISEREQGVADVYRSEMKCVNAPNEQGAAYHKVSKILDKMAGKTLICLTQCLALGALQAIRDRDFRIGGHLGFASFDDLPLCDIWQPSICRIEQNIEGLGGEAVRLLVAKIQDPTVKQPLEIRMPARLIWDDSVLPSPTG